MLKLGHVVRACVIGLVATVQAGAQSACRNKVYFAFQVAQQARLIRADTIDWPKLVTLQPLGPNAVQFVVDTAGIPVVSSLKYLAVKDSALISAFHYELGRLRFEPARGANTCKVAELVVGNVYWPSNHSEK